MAAKRTAVILINVGTPNSPSVKDVRKYLSEFLNDYRVIDIPWLLRKLLVNLIIVPFRAPKSAKLYKSLWTEKGSPLLFHTQSVSQKLQTQLGSNYTVFVAMRYGNPNIRDVMETVNNEAFSKIIIVPMFPQYASSSTGTAIEAVMKQAKNWTVIPEIKVVGQFYDNPQFIDAFAKQIESYHPEKYDHILFSYHGLPLSHIEAVHPQKKCDNCECINQLPQHGEFCYKATCYQTTRLLATKLGLPKEKFTLSFQSRLSKKWLTPFSDKTLISLAKQGVKSVLIVAPAFVTDCLETTIELGVEYRELFLKAGGEKLDFVESLNDSEDWIITLKSLITEN